MGGSRKPSDEEVVRRVLEGDEASAAELFERHRAELRAAVRRWLPPSLRGRLGESDVVQDAYLAAYLHLGDFEDRGDGSFRRWLRRILERKIANEVRDHLQTVKRDPRREVPLSKSTGAASPAGRTPTPSEEAMSAEALESLRAHVQGLAEDHRTVLHLVHREGLTLVQAAARMNRSPDAVRKLYGRAVTRLSERMGGAE